MRTTEGLETNSGQGLVREMTRWDLAGLTVNGVIGAGIFGLPSSVGKLLGVASPIAFVVCAVIVYIVVLCFAEAASYFNETGGPYLYSRVVFGSFVGFEVGWATWIARVVAFGANSNLLISYFAFFVPAAASGLGRTLVLIAVPAVLMLINIRGVAIGARLGTSLAFLKMGALLLFALIGLAFVNWSRFSGMSLSRQGNWSAAILLLIYAYTGFEASVIPAAEAKNPRKDAAWALIAAIGICAAVYVAIQVVAVGTLPDLGASTKPLADAAEKFLGGTAAAFISVLACISILGNLSNIALVMPRITYAFAERGDFPTVFGKLHQVYRTPVISIVFFSVIAALLSLSGTFVRLATISVVARLASYLVTCLTVPALRRGSDKRPGFRAPLGPVLPVGGVLICVWLLAQVAPHDLLDFALASIAGALLYLARPRRGLTSKSA